MEIVKKLQENKQADIKSAVRVLSLEAESIQKMADNIGEEFADAIDMFASVEGRIIVTGMGKSGHVAKKIAATLSSTGTPAFFVHPGEASHGDLGMVVRGDVVLALSNSGEVKELSDIIGYTRRYSIPLIGMTSNGKSALGSKSDLALVLPPCPEACPNGLAPTTSTTLMLALGDAIAVALLERRGFTPTDYKVFHPGGNLGQQLMVVNEIMHKENDMPLISIDSDIKSALEGINEKSFGCVGVLSDDGKLEAILTDGDVRREICNDFLNKNLSDIVTKNPKTVKKDSLVGEAVAIMSNSEITSLFVVDLEGKPVGFLHMHDCLKAGFA